ncbi:MAG: TOBE domain-containing protein [Actinomycetota bacterium]|nr:TOBE domain-containing protein [Actinomycetota bacterium]
MNLIDGPPWDPDVTIGVRPEHVALVPPGTGRLDGRIAEIEFTGTESVVHVDCGATWVLVKVPRGFSPRLGAETGVSFDDTRVRRFSGRDGAAL